jgi:hypothetical protein
MELFVIENISDRHVSHHTSERFVMLQQKKPYVTVDEANRNAICLTVPVARVT